ncbi:shikimate kinase [Paenibacillus hexagrammi]|uniref:Shikimate kinase n=1 Tax=Paenibacillus hexagrammi TaxID=2908839 RepID=A0ABY3SP83_9BACL|nr:shikimate kinase [Paenibacillus sp. YPD9-1]
MSTRNIVLVGFMGTGKSTIGKKLADQLGWNFQDSDAFVEQQQQTSIADMFREQGEAFFRKLESQALENLLAGEGQVVATGGGAVLAEANRTCMLSNGLVVALTATAEIIIQRVQSDQSRPLLQGNLEERVHTLMEQRRHAYDFAHLTIDTSALSTDEIAAKIIEHAGLLN